MEKEERGKEIQVVIFKLGEEEFGGDIFQIREIIRVPEITPVPQAPDFVEGMINLRGQVLAVIDLAKRFGMKGEREQSKDSRIIVVELDDNLLGMIVDAVPEVLRVPEDKIESTPEAITSWVHRDFIRGIANLEGRLIVILDLNRILTFKEKESLSRTNIEKQDNL
ncbi:MAG: chemotaxis protein CheW [Candidatus Omnitrophica bacterium]|nr:chemotaxis protein CheW [Candidatus Omnitrophota bacterium]